MESTIVKVSDSSKFVVDLKRKRPQQVSSKRNADSSFLVNVPEYNLAKRRKPSVCRSTGSGQSPSSKSVVRYYLNFLKSGQPQRVMYYQDGEWISFPMATLDLMKENFKRKNAIFEVKLDDNVYVVDFVHMIKFELISGIHRSIAWIDERGSCFFPEVVCNEFEEYADEVAGCYDHAHENESPADEIKLQLDIDINLLDPSKLKECTGESFDLVEHHALKKYDGFSDESRVNIDDRKIKQVAPKCKNLDMESIRIFFLKGCSDAIEIVDIYRGSSLIMDTCEELFHKQVEITANYRGDANVRYAWLPCTKSVSYSIMKYGIGSVAMSYHSYGVGVHLSSTDCINLSVNLSDDDENGVQYVVLCRVALGNMEVVNRGSEQFHPSSEDYDTGVDDLNNPKFHVIWNMDLNTRIYPECVVSFKASSSIKGYNLEQEKACVTSGVTASHGDPCKVVLESTPNKMATKFPEANDVTTRTSLARKSAWMPFPILFASISHQVSPSAMKLIMIEYNLFKNNNTSRNEFVKKLRLIVGDKLLMSTIKKLQCHQVAPLSDVQVPNPHCQPNLGCTNDV